MIKEYLLTAIVLDTEDPEKLGRIRILLPGLSGDYDDQKLWARVVAPLAGEDRGLCFLPEIDDEVLVAFAQGNISSAYVLGGLWSSPKPPPEGAGIDGNDLKMIKTRSGHTLLFNDHDGEELISISDKNGNCLEIATGEDRITIKSQSKLEIIADEDMTLTAKTITLSASDSIEIKAGSSLTLDGGNTADLKAGTVNIN
jgi:uncharacterized protein involved in type VI secretion and phage assembly